MALRFTKMHGLGNDFMVIDGIRQSVNLTSEQVRLWSDRHFGVGFDQLLLVEAPESDQALFKYRIFNADGEEVEQCGNGARCFARFVREQGLTDAEVIPVETRAGLLTLKIIDHSRVEVNMGVPHFTPAHIPMNVTDRQDSYELVIDDVRIQFMALSIGNPHAVIRVPDVNQAPVETLGPVLERHELFPQRVNVGFMQIINNREFKLRVFERGAGETLACGSGACAAFAAACSAGLIDQHAIARLRGGDLSLSWQGEGKPVMMTGATATVYQGDIDI